MFSHSSHPLVAAKYFRTEMTINAKSWCSKMSFSGACLCFASSTCVWTRASNITTSAIAYRSRPNPLAFSKHFQMIRIKRIRIFKWLELYEYIYNVDKYLIEITINFATILVSNSFGINSSISCFHFLLFFFNIDLHQKISCVTVEENVIEWKVKQDNWTKFHFSTIDFAMYFFWVFLSGKRISPTT